MAVVQIENGFYRNQEVSGVFPVVSPMKEAKDGTFFITVDGTGTEFERDKMRVKVNPECVTEVGATKESDEEAMNRIAERFAILDQMLVRQWTIHLHVQSTRLNLQGNHTYHITRK